ncbi:hypothetical protein M2459_000903 [Parabacteroides sp. PF5-5]|uniref:hypothetical protein n=1 Tax=unclassified Parabacteroides TaxID=2649774 RepID=UPI002476A49B|nr:MULTISPECIES: hypothetical protein [unclassified Parabacteroides]MDH6304175.1 hypothetical protein [Parabacteroides sp. PH5-39]MDH6315109.1 hypothetical protein [Parabacteroides sp. PF5-13]MDH6318770.1 hypothetical protein [Parabacteroides sp. PH5-13]MDH6322499.1 hypothetical protein [Parabacteroides sp. PH5-8]MDH6326365.1 hypothetical protein [Parabacteroides sp. PH5-41]
MEMKLTFLSRIIRKWWFYVLIILLQFILLPYAAYNFSYEGIGDIINYTLTHSLQGDIRNYYFIFQLVSLAFLVLLFVYKNRFARAFNVYILVSYLLFAILQNVAITDKYGVSAVLINVFMFLLVAFCWLSECIKPQNDYSFLSINLKNSWLLVLALFAYWLPLAGTNTFDFSPLSFIKNGSSTAFCMMTPVFLAIMSVNFPRINKPVYRITSFIGIIIGLYNMASFQHPEKIAMGIVHLPLLIISVYSFVKSFKIKDYGKEF